MFFVNVTLTCYDEKINVTTTMVDKIAPISVLSTIVACPAIVDITEVSRGDINRGVKSREVKADPKTDFTFVDTFIARVTMYTAEECQSPSSKTFGFTASGEYVQQGFVAMGKSIPFNTKIKIEGFEGVYIKKDTGSAIHSDDVDVYTTDSKLARNFNEKRRVWIIEYGKGSK